MPGARGAALLVLLVLLALVFPLGRAALRHDGPPAFFVERLEGIPVALGKGFPAPGVHQFSDGSRSIDVIKMTIPDFATVPLDDPLLQQPLRPGEQLEISSSQTQDIELTKKWMPAGQRLALGIPLHPDRMERNDWQILPGVGPRLALAIDFDRQKNGDFASLAALERVKGVGPNRIKKWQEFFQER